MYRIKIRYDRCAYDPRADNENADVMYCRHSHYNLGDKDAENPTEEVSIITLHDDNGNPYKLECEEDADGYERDITNNRPSFERVRDLLEDHRDALELEGSTADYYRADEALQYVAALNAQEELCARAGIALWRPLYLHDHSTVSISAGDPGDRWDSGQVGWQYLDEETFKTEFDNDHDRALRYMDATLKEYDEYLRGNVWGFTVEKGVRVTKTYPDGRVVETIEWEDHDSCWGFIGDWWREGDPTGMRDHLPNELRAVFDKMDWDDADKWCYTDDVSDEVKED